VDAHQIIAPYPPRPRFISCGIPEKGDVHWRDQQGSSRATVATGAAFRLLGARNRGVTADAPNALRAEPHC
jgi:hypothetical protein